jgi:plastocyanin
MRKLVVAIAALLLLALPASGLGAATISVRIAATGFSPKTVTINQGDVVKWTNGDKVNHQLVANNGAFASHILRPGDAYSFTFNAAGTYHYHDALKPSLAGTIVVKGPPPTVALAVSAPIVTYGGMTIISGTVSNLKANESVTILAQPYGSSAQQITTLVTGANGGFTYSTGPTMLTTYTAKWKSATSQTVTVQVRPKVTLTRSGSRLFAKVTATPSFAGRSIYLQRHSSFGQWVTVGKLRLGPNSGRIFKAPHRRGRFVYRVYITTNQAGTGYLDSWSNAVTVRFRR